MGKPSGIEEYGGSESVETWKDLRGKLVGVSGFDWLCGVKETEKSRMS